MKKNVVLTGLLAAMVFFTTAYILHIPTGINNGYIHLGDTMIYVAATLLPTPYAIAAAAIGGGLADVLTGAAMWAVPTILIKSLMVLPFTAKQERLLCRRNLLAPVFAGLIGVAGYFLAELVLVTLSGGTIQAAVGGALTAVLPNVVQELGGGAVFILLAMAMDRLGVKQRLVRMA